MLADTKRKRIVFLESLTHYLTAFVVLTKGLDKLFTAGKPFIGITFCIFGLVILFGTIFHHKAARLLKHFKAYVLSIEAIIMATIGYLYIAEGKQLIQYTCFFAAAMFVVALVMYFRKTAKNHEVLINEPSPENLTP